MDAEDELRRGVSGDAQRECTPAGHEAVAFAAALQRQLERPRQTSALPVVSARRIHYCNLKALATYTAI